jgi:phosphoglucosamine mutase
VSHDGDADRLIAATHEGGEVDGDVILAILARERHHTGTLEQDAVATTVMTNLGFKRSMAGLGIEVVETPVGDRYVLEAMLDRGLNLGGEQSGHIIDLDHATTGDGVLTGLKLADALATSDRPLSELSDVFEPYPQVLLNVRVASKELLDAAEELWDEVRRAEAELREDGRVLVRASGTEPVVRVMVEAADDATAVQTAERLAQAVRRALGAA